MSSRVSRSPASRAACDDGLAHGVGVGVRPAGEVVVQVVELADDGDAGQHHLGEDRPRQGEVGVGVEVPRDGIHLLAPGPEVAAVAVGAAAQRAVEGVAVARWPARAGRRRAGGRRRSRGRARRCTSANRPVDDVEPDARGQPRGQPGVLGPVGRRGRCVTAALPARSSSTAVRAATPSRQSDGSACSAGEWETPVGLRTKSIAVGTPALARMPASCPAPVPRTGYAAEPGAPAARSARCRRRSTGSRTPG